MKQSQWTFKSTHLLVMFFLIFSFTILPCNLRLSPVKIAEAASIKLNKTKVTVYTGNTYTLKLSGTNKTPVWSSSNKSIASVTNKGKITAKKKGTVTITATLGSKKYSCKVTVKNPYINESSLQLGIDEKQTLQIIGAKSGCEWFVSDTSIAEVSDDGQVHTKKAGTTKVYAIYRDKTYTCMLTVIERMIFANASTITCSEDTTFLLTLDESLSADNIMISVKDNTIARAKADVASKNILPITILPKKAGTTTISISSSECKDQITVRVTVINPENLSTKELSAKEIYTQVVDSTVQIETDLALGSGFFYEDSKIITNYHVIEDASYINVITTDKKTYPVDHILAYDKERDIAILSVPISKKPLPICTRERKVGENVFALGSSLGLTNTFSGGMITSTKRVYNETNYIQFNAAISAGNSGGPLFNAYGEVIGIVTMTLSEGQNLNFAFDLEQLYEIPYIKPMTVEEFYNANKKTTILPSDAYPDADAFQIMIEDQYMSWSPSTAQTLGSNTMVLGATDYNYCDYYKIEVKEESTIVLFGGNISGDKDDLKYLYFTLVDESCDNAIAYDDFFTYNDTVLLGFSCTLQPGTYYLAVYSDDDFIQDSLSYTFCCYVIAGTF